MLSPLSCTITEHNCDASRHSSQPGTLSSHRRRAAESRGALLRFPLQERTEEHQKQLMKFIATAMGVMGTQEDGIPSLNMTALNTLQNTYAAGRPAKRQRFLEGAADSLSVETSHVESALPEVLEVQVSSAHGPLALTLSPSHPLQPVVWGSLC